MIGEGIGFLPDIRGGIMMGFYMGLVQLASAVGTLIKLALSVLGIYTMFLAIKALKIYIDKNS